MKKTFLFAVFVFFTCLQSYSQITTNEKPVSVQRGIGVLIKDNSKGFVELPVPDLKRVLHEDSLYYEKNPNSLLLTSFPISVSLDIIEEGRCIELGDGGKLWQMEIHADKALALDFVFSKFWLPKGGKFFIFNPSTNESIGAITSQYLSGEKIKPNRFSTGIVKGSDVVLEYYQPAREKELPVLLLERSYFTYLLSQNFSQSCDCEVNINCSEGINWQKEKNAVALVYRKFNQRGAWCTGSLVNNTQKNLSPLFLTANHCLEIDLTSSGGYKETKDAIDDNDLSDWVFVWKYEQDSCTATTQPYNFKLTTGAIVKANNPYSDFALLELEQDPLSLSITDGYIPYYLGWDVSGFSGTGGVCIHHPQADVKKISTYSCTPQSAFMNSYSSVYWGVQWIETENGHGITESGSSGSPLINNNHQVIGQLAGSNNSCSHLTGTSYYGKLSASWTGNNNSDIRRRLDYWLNPEGINIQVINGLFPFTIIGSDNLYGTSVYSIPNLPSCFYVTWSLTGDNASNFTLLQNTPSSNQCTITRKQNVEFSGSTNLSLSAYVTYYGLVIYTATKIINAPYISGDSNPCLTDVYSVEGLPNNYTVSWNLSGTGYSVITNFTPPNTENNNYLGVQRASSQSYASGIITANLLDGNTVVGTLTKNISSASGFTGTWYQSSSIFPPFIPDATPSDLECTTYYVDPNKTIVLQSADLFGQPMTCNNGNVALFHNNNTISFYTDTTNGHIFVVRGYKPGTCDAYQFIFNAIGEPSLDLSINASGQENVFSLFEKRAEGNDNREKSPYAGQWQLTIVQYETGQTVYEGSCESGSITANTAGWKPGVYVVVAKANDRTINQKISISE